MPFVNTRPYIISVDDEEDVTDLIAFNLRRENYEVATVANGRGALELIARRRPDLLLLDLMLPDLDGFAICEILRRQAETADLPIVILSAWNEPDSRHLGLELGAIDFLNKPFSPRALTARVNELLSQRRTSATSPSIRS
jgi:DNA-binding response OmpR family regulator